LKTVALLYDHMLDVGGVESHLLGLLRQAPADRYRFVLVAQTSRQFAARAREWGARVIDYRRWQGLDPRSATGLARLFKQEKVDLVHAHSPMAALSGRLAARWRHLPAVVTIHLPVMQYHGLRQSGRARLGRWLYTVLDRWLNYTASTRLVYVSQQVRDQLVTARHSPAARSLVIPVGIPLDDFLRPHDRQALRQELEARPEDVILTFVGRLDEQKGVDTLLDAAAIALPNAASARLWIIGDGPLRADLANRAHRLSLMSRVRFWGRQEGVARFLWASDLFVLPSRFEALPVALLEALACGLPVIATQVGETGSVVQEGVNGFLVPSGDAAALAQSMRRLIESPSLRQQMAVNACQTSERFDEKLAVCRLIEVYENVCPASG
jgi:glycosyltransferase involved in cell wall biosynthesis